jgi:uncharacterized protein
MRIRTITTGLELTSDLEEERFLASAAFLQDAKQAFQDAGYEVQTVRVATQPWPEYLGEFNDFDIIGDLAGLEELAQGHGVDFLGIGHASEPEHIELVPDILKNTSNVSGSAWVGPAKDGGGIDHQAALAAAASILRLSFETPGGMGNFNFAAIANCPPGIPFFPAAYHRGPPAFSLGLECGPLLGEAFSQADGLEEAEDALKLVLESRLKPLEEVAQGLAEKAGVAFRGIDVSTNPSLEPEGSVAYAFEELELCDFGEPGTLAITGLVTRVLKNLDVQTCGYSGVMLPILEDLGLAERCSEGAFDINDILLYSSVCGTGLDCVPLPGDVPVDKLYGILIDMATMALALNKPLSARLFPVPDKLAGERTEFKSPYLVDCDVMEVK